MGDQVFLKISPWKGVIRFQNQGKLSPRYIGPFPIIERIRPVAYRLELSPGLEKIHDVFHISMLKKYMPDPSHILKSPPVQLRENPNFELQPVQILDQQDKVHRKKVMLGSNRAYKHDMDKQNAADNKIASLSYKPYACFTRDIKDLSYIIT